MPGDPTLRQSENCPLPRVCRPFYGRSLSHQERPKRLNPPNERQDESREPFTMN